MFRADLLLINTRYYSVYTANGIVMRYVDWLLVGRNIPILPITTIIVGIAVVLLLLLLLVAKRRLTALT